MIYVRVTRQELALLRRNTIRTVMVAKRPGARTPEIDDALAAYSPAERDENAEITHKREVVRCVIATVTPAGAYWKVAYHAGSVEPPRFMRARPGAVRLTPNPKGGDPITDGDADYTTSRSAAMRGEPECVPESWDRRVARVASSEPPRDRRPWA